MLNDSILDGDHYYLIIIVEIYVTLKESPYKTGYKFFNKTQQLCYSEGAKIK